MILLLPKRPYIKDRTSTIISPQTPRLKHRPCGRLHRMPHGIQIDTGINLGGPHGFMAQAFSDHEAVRPRGGLPAAQGSPQVMNTHILQFCPL